MPTLKPARSAIRGRIIALGRRKVAPDRVFRLVTMLEFRALNRLGVINFFTVFNLFSYLLPRYRLVDEGDVTSNAKRSAGILFPG